jgi:hypothetical protein
VPTIGQVVETLAGQYRWGLHPWKVLVALLAPVVVAWLADRRLRDLTAAIETEDARIQRLPRIRRR